MENTTDLSLAETDWILEYLYGNSVIGDENMGASTLSFSTDGKVSGIGSCNNYFGPYTFEDKVLVIGPLARTKKYCPNMELEDQILHALQISDSVKHSSGKLELSGEGKTLLVFRPA